MVSSVRPSDWDFPTMVGRFAAIFALHVLVLAPAVHSMERYGFSLHFPSHRAVWARSQVQPWDCMIQHPPKAPSTALDHWLASRAYAGATPSLSVELRVATMILDGSIGTVGDPTKSSLAD